MRQGLRWIKNNTHEIDKSAKVCMVESIHALTYAYTRTHARTDADKSLK